MITLLRNLTFIVAAALVITLALPLSVIGEEVITLTTIMPGQDTLRVKRGAVGVNWRQTATLSDAQIGDNNLLIEGNVGIGTTAPAAKLHVNDGEIPGNSIDDDGDGATDETGQEMVFTTEGKVGIGTTSPQNKLDVEGAVAIGATYSGTSSAPSNGMIIEGNVGIGTTEPEDSKGSGGYVDAQDVWLRDANSGVGGWASEGGGVTTWVSNWESISKGATKVLTHDLDSATLTVTVLFSTSSTGANAVVMGETSRAGDQPRGLQVKNITSTQLTVQAGAGAAGYIWNSSGGAVYYSSGYCRVIAMKAD